MASFLSAVRSAIAGSLCGRWRALPRVVPLHRARTTRDAAGRVAPRHPETFPFAPAAVRLLRKRLDPGLELQQSHAGDTLVMAAERVQFLHVCPQTSSAHFLLPSPHPQALPLASLPHHPALMGGSGLLRVLRRDTSIKCSRPSKPAVGKSWKGIVMNFHPTVASATC